MQVIAEQTKHSTIVARNKMRWAKSSQAFQLLSACVQKHGMLSTLNWTHSTPMRTGYDIEHRLTQPETPALPDLGL
ncbi:hypothetical protein EBQ24_05305 [Allofranklinella schreckenbergeri]|uniref:Uncharacterized protein n=2 Tax=Allofranklinella schreckenbergeri TaxID=1076744 RepID=A0A3M6R534_9BURK|nr:hypothetical protein EBQ24_05305 [Allofranklinella schreckenbergeri]